MLEAEYNVQQVEDWIGSEEVETVNICNFQNFGHEVIQHDSVFPISSLSDYDSVRFKKQKQEYPEYSLALGLNR